MPIHCFTIKKYVQEMQLIGVYKQTVAIYKNIAYK